MDNVLIGRSASGFDFRLWTDAVDGDGCRSIAAMSTLPPPHAVRSVVYGSFPYVPPPLPPFQYAPYLQSSLSLPSAASSSPPGGSPPAPASHDGAHGGKEARRAAASAGRCRRAQARHRAEEDDDGVRRVQEEEAAATGAEAGEEPPPRAQRRKPLERATPLPPATAVEEALDDLEREVTRGFVQDLMHALAPPPSSLPLPTFSLVRAATMKAAAASCAV